MTGSQPETCPLPEDLIDHVEGVRLNPDVERHLEDCPACRELADKVRLYEVLSPGGYIEPKLTC